jgi:hypothetical protein
VRALESQTLSTTATCFQCDGDGRRAGLEIRCVCHPTKCPRSVRSRGRFPPCNAAGAIGPNERVFLIALLNSIFAFFVIFVPFCSKKPSVNAKRLVTELIGANQL